MGPVFRGPWLPRRLMPQPLPLGGHSGTLAQASVEARSGSSMRGFHSEGGGISSGESQLAVATLGRR